MVTREEIEKRLRDSTIQMVFFAVGAMGATVISLVTIFFGSLVGVNGVLFYGAIIICAALFIYAWGERRRAKKILAKFDPE